MTTEKYFTEKLHNNAKIMQALILAGGKGKRMKPLTNKIPKVLLPVTDRPFLFWLINFLKKQGIKEFILATGYKGKMIEDYFGNGGKFGLKIIYSKEKKSLDTGGAVKNARKLIKGKEILIINGDSLVKINVKKMLKFHRSKKLPITMAVCKISNTQRYGKVIIDKKNTVAVFKEKNKNTKKGIINAGFYIFQKEIIESFPKKTKISLEREIFPKFVGRIGVFRINDYFIDMGTPEDYQKIQKEYQKVWRN